MLALAWMAPEAAGCDWIAIDVDTDAPCDHDDDPPEVVVRGSVDEDGQLWFGYGMQFTPDAPAHHLSGRLVGENDSYVGGEIRYMPESDVLWTGRAGAGLDLFGSGDWDLTLGLWIGTAGEWDRTDERAVLYASPMAGTEVALGVEGDHLFARYRWLAGIGSGPIDELLTEQELTIGYKVLPELHLYGQYFILSPGELDNRSGVGLGGRLVF